MERKLISEPRRADADEVLELPHEMPPAGEFGSNLIFFASSFLFIWMWNEILTMVDDKDAAPSKLIWFEMYLSCLKHAVQEK